MGPFARALTVGALLAAGCAKDRTWGVSCEVQTDCATEFQCMQRFGASKKEPRFCTKPCRQHDEALCPVKFHCEPEPGSLRNGQCEPSNWAPP